jgi:hypothetical protein
MTPTTDLGAVMMKTQEVRRKRRPAHSTSLSYRQSMPATHMPVVTVLFRQAGIGFFTGNPRVLFSNPYPYPPIPVPAPTGTGFHGYGCRFETG